MIKDGGHYHHHAKHATTLGQWEAAAMSRHNPSESKVFAVVCSAVIRSAITARSVATAGCTTGKEAEVAPGSTGASAASSTMA